MLDDKFIRKRAAYQGQSHASFADGQTIDLKVKMCQRLSVQADRCFINQKAGRFGSCRGELQVLHNDLSIAIKPQGAEGDIESPARQFRGNSGLKKIGEASVIQINHKCDEQTDCEKQNDAAPAENPPKMTPSSACWLLQGHELFWIGSH
jgi:hypothetical protein